MMIYPGVFFFLHFFEIFIFQAVGQKMALDDKKVLSGALHISGTIYHMIVIYGALL